MDYRSENAIDVSPHTTFTWLRFILGAVFFLLALAWAGPLRANHEAVANLSATPDRFTAGDSTELRFSGSPGVLSYKLEIYDSNSDTTPVTTLVPSEIPAGSGAFSVSWGGATEASATPKNGVYTVTLTDTDGAGPTTTVTIATPPNLASLSHTPATLTPNGDGVDDVITVTAKTQAAHSDTLELRVFPKGNTSNPVWTGTMSRQADQMTFTATWDGKNAADPPQVQPAGEYDLRVVDTAGGVDAPASLSDVVTVARPLAITEFRVDKDPDGAEDAPFRHSATFIGRFSEAANYSLTIQTPDGKSVKNFANQDTEFTHVWDAHLGNAARSGLCTNVPGSTTELVAYQSSCFKEFPLAAKTVASVEIDTEYRATGYYSPSGQTNRITYTLYNGGTPGGTGEAVLQPYGNDSTHYVRHSQTFAANQVADKIRISVHPSWYKKTYFTISDQYFYAILYLRSPRVIVRYADGTFDISPPNGTFNYNLKVTSLSGDRQERSGTVNLDVQGPQVASFTMAPATFGNDMRPNATIGVQFSEAAQSEIWAVYAASCGDPCDQKDSFREHVRWSYASFESSAPIPPFWDGRSPTGELPRTDYRLYVVARDLLGNMSVPQRLCEFPSRNCNGYDYAVYPEAVHRIPVIAPLAPDPTSFGGVNARATRLRTTIDPGTDFDYVWINGTKSQLWHRGRWKLTIKPYPSPDNPSPGVLQTYEGDLLGPTTIDKTWDGRDPARPGEYVAKGDYRVIVEAWDSYGNAAAPEFAAVSYNGEAPAVNPPPDGTEVAFTPRQFATDATDTTTKFRAELTESLPWTLTVTSGLGQNIISQSGVSQQVNFTWDAALVPAPAGVYDWTFTVTNAAGHVTRLKGQVIKGNPNPPVTDFRVSYLAFGSPSRPETTFTASSPYDVEWEVVVRVPAERDPAMPVVKRVTSVGSSLLQIWNGLKDVEAGGTDATEMVNSGAYDYRVEARMQWDKTVGVTSWTGRLLFDREPPLIKNLVTENTRFDPRMSTAAISADIEDVADVTWTLQVTPDAGGPAVYTVSGNWAAIDAMWNGKVTGSNQFHPDGDYTARLTATDAAGNVATPVTVALRLDKDPPVIQNWTPNKAAFNDEVRFAPILNEPATWTFSVRDTADVEVYATGPTEPTTAPTITWNGMGTDGLRLEDTYKAYLKARDALGHETTSAAATIRYDVTPPVVTGVTATPGTFSTSVTFRGTTVENPTAVVTLRITDKRNNLMHQQPLNNNKPVFIWYGTSGASAVDDGEYLYSLQFADTAGNVTEVTGSVNKDTMAPRVTEKNIGPAAFTNEVRFKLEFDEAASYDLTILNAAGNDIFFTHRTALANSIDYTWTGQVYPGLFLVDGRYYYELAFRDAAGNVGMLTGELTRDTVPPVLANLAATPDKFTTSTVISASASEVVDWTVTLTSSSGSTVDSFGGRGNTVARTWQPRMGDKNLDPGRYTIKLTATDLAGHPADPLVFEVTVLPPPPGVELLPAEPNPFRSETRLNAKLERLADWRLDIKQGNAVVQSYSGTGMTVDQVWNGRDRNGTGLQDGIYTYVLTVITPGDSRTAERTVRKDTQAPTITGIIASPSTFTTETAIVANVPGESEIQKWRIAITNLKGDELADFSGTTNSVSAVWYGKDRHGTDLGPGVYLIRVEVTDLAGNTAIASGSVTRAALGAPTLQQPAATPNPFRGATVITSLISPAAQWRLEFMNGKDEVVRKIEGNGSLVAQSWDGKDDAGNAVSPGAYKYVLTATANGRSSAVAGTVEKASPLTTQQPVVISNLRDDPDPFEPGGNPDDDVLTFTATFSRETDWTLDILDRSGWSLRQFTGTGPAMVQAWDGTDRSNSQLEPGTYTYRLTVPGSEPVVATVTKRGQPTSGTTNGNNSGNTGTNNSGTGSTGSATATSGPTNSSSGAASSGSSPTITIQNGAKAPEISVTSVAVGPNPTRGAVTITAVLSDAAAWTVAIRDENGENVETASGSGAAIAVTWNGRVAGREAPDGLYSFIITATNSKGTAAATGSFRRDSMTRVSGLAVVPTSFSPNGDGILDQAQITADLGEESAWSLQIVGSTGNVVRTLSGKGLRLATSWDGTGDQGLTVPDGEYRLQLLVQDAVGNRAESSVRVRVDTTAPPVPTLRAPDPAKGDVPLSWGRGNGLFGFPDSPAAQTVSDPSGILKVEVWRAAGDHQVKVADLAPGVDEWTDDRVEPGTYQYRLRVVDRAGNAAASTPTRVVVLQGQGVCETIVVPGAATGCETPNGRIKVRIPAGAVSHGGRLMVVAAPPGSDYPELGRVKVGPPVQVQVVDDQGLPLTLQQSITLTLGYDPALVHDHRLLSAYVWREDRSAWHYLGGSVDPNRREVAFSLKRPGVVAVMVDPDMPLFADVTELWAAAEVRGLAGHRITRGYPDNTFRPDNAITRSEFVTFLARAMGLTASPDAKLTAKDAADVPEWAAQAMLAATEAGLIKGFEDGTLRPHEPITRSQMMVVVVRALGLEGGRTSDLRNGSLPFADDASVPGWARGHVKLVTQLSELPFVRGGVFEPERNATRAETAWTLMLLLDRTGY